MTTDHFFQSIEEHYQNKSPFVVYRKPNQTQVISLLQHNDTLHDTSDFSEKGFVFSPFDALEKTVLIPSEVSETLVLKNYRGDEALQAKPLQDSLTPSNEDKTFFMNLTNQGIQFIKESSLQKVVLSRQESLVLKENNPLIIFKKLLQAYNHALVYCWYHPKVGLWLGATPETLFKIEGKQFSIMALAGTQNYEGSLNVVWQPKEKHEQQLVTDFIVHNLQPFVNDLTLSDLESVRAGNLIHLKTMISAHLKAGIPLKQIIKALHPTPAVCGLPKLDAKDFLLKFENYNREFYTGFLGELNYEVTKSTRASKRNIENRAYNIHTTSTQLYVNLRCMQLKNDKAFIYIGGGITERSVAENEWEETVSKAQTIKNVL